MQERVENTKQVDHACTSLYCLFNNA